MTKTFALSGLMLFVCLANSQTSEIEKGRAVYRSNCAFCHGLTGVGGRGPDLVSNQQKAPGELKRIIRNGVPGSSMPAFKMDPDELDSLVVFLKELAGKAPAYQPVSGDSKHGRAVYAKSGCSGCHQIGSDGSTYGPDLTRIGGARSIKYLTESIVNPTADIPKDWDGVTVTTKDGKKLTGVRVNEDTFTVQLRLPSQQYRSFVKDEVKEVLPEKLSLMPAYKNLAKQDLDDLVAYLTTLKGPVEKIGNVEERKGIHD